MFWAKLLFCHAQLGICVAAWAVPPMHGIHKVAAAISKEKKNLTDREETRPRDDVDSVLDGSRTAVAPDISAPVACGDKAGDPGNLHGKDRLARENRKIP